MLWSPFLWRTIVNTDTISLIQKSYSVGNVEGTETEKKKKIPKKVCRIENHKKIKLYLDLTEETLLKRKRAQYIQCYAKREYIFFCIFYSKSHFIQCARKSEELKRVGIGSKIVFSFVNIMYNIILKSISIYLFFLLESTHNIHFIVRKNNIRWKQNRNMIPTRKIA